MKFQDILWNDGWKFALTEINSFTVGEINKIPHFYDVEIPHDWLINDTRELYKTGEGWYIKKFTLEKGDLEGKLFVTFEGVYMNCSVYVNGKEVGGNTYGYSSFDLEITGAVREGENEIAVQVRHEAPNSRWYSGAGIYRSVRLRKRATEHIALNGVYASTRRIDDKNWELLVDTELCGSGEVSFELLDKDGKVVATGNGEKATTSVENPGVWDIDSPVLYTLRTTLTKNGEVIDAVSCKIGFRTTEFNPQKGFILNGRQLKLHGVCMHHDLGALGSAMNRTAMARQLRIIKSYGANSVRTSHNMPSVELMELCDEMGILVNSESFDMWENPKTTFDNARFFKETYKRDVMQWVKRDRNHPSVIMWSIGNEIADTHASPRGLEVAKMLVEEVSRYDPRKNAVPTIGSNYMPWENAQKVADFLKIAGYNYAEHLYDEHHEKHPDWFIYGSETASTVRSRGIYHLPFDSGILTHDDLQCSDLGNSVVGWGRAHESAWIMDRNRGYCGGQYIWTGFDYIGEPTPYSTKNSYFGIVDTAGLPKESYYLYKAVWTDGDKNPFVHILPHWDWNEGDIVPVMTYSNVEDVELFLNGKSLGKQHVDLLHSDVLHGRWDIPFEKGEITAKAYKNDEVVAEDRISSFSEPVKIILKPEKTEMNADGRDLIFVEAQTVDKDGNFVANARNRLFVEVSGAARLVGIDSGDSTDYDSYKSNNKRLFSGKLIFILEATLESGDINVKVTSDGLETAETTLMSLPCEKPEGVSVVTENMFPCYKQEENKSIQLRKIELSAPTRTLTAENKSMKITTKLLPENAADKNIKWKCLLVSGAECQLAGVEETADGCVLTAKGDGSFILRAYSCNGGNVPEIISDMPVTIEGVGEALISPYKFVSAALYGFSNKDELWIVERGAVSRINDRTVIGFTNVDFGSYGSDQLKIYIGNCGFGIIDVEIWEGNPDNGGRLIDTVQFHENGRWEGFDPSDFTLPERLKGIKDIAFVLDKGGAFGGFELVKLEKAKQKLHAGDNDGIYGDEFEIVGEKVEKIGNNVILNFNDMDFGDGVTKITVCGKTPHENDTMQIRYDEDGVQKTQLVEFRHADDYEAREFALEKISGVKNISFVFLPGAEFSFDWFRFE